MRHERERTFGVEAIHHATNQLKLVLQAEVYEVGVDKNAVGWYKSSVMGEEKG